MRYLAIFNNDNGESQAAMISVPEERESQFPFGVDGDSLGLDNYNPGGGLTLIEMPTETDFRPAVVDVQTDDEVPMQFIDLPAVAEG
jgi:hypothetical protein